MLNPVGFWSKVGPLDCVLDIGAGDSFADIYGVKRFAFLWFSKVLVLMRGKPLVLSPQTIGPFNKGMYRLLAKQAMEKATLIVARDDQSFALLRGLALSAKSVLATDVAFALPYEDRSSERSSARRRVGINVSGLLFKDARDGQNRFGLDFDYAELTIKLIKAFAAMPDVEVNLFTHVSASENAEDSDGWICDRLAKKYPGVTRIPDFSNPSEAKSFMSGLDFVVSGRMHACIGAFSAGVVVVPIAYSRKFSGLFGTLGYKTMVPTNGMNTDESTRFVLDCYERRDQINVDRQQALSRTGALLDIYRQELAALFSKLAPVQLNQSAVAPAI
jgi:polysaccharide pyruvyl transferase WcaK-like protein